MTAMAASKPHPAHASDLELLGALIGVRESRRRYRGSLRPFFSDAAAGQRLPKCSAARELVKRWLHEELQARTVFACPTAVGELLKLHFAGREYESFVFLYLDAQNRLIEAEEMFRGTLTQTKAALSLVDVRVLDHIIVAGPMALSFAERGLL
jgi:DNA repair protein RadC